MAAEKSVREFMVEMEVVTKQVVCRVLKATTPADAKRKALAESVEAAKQTDGWSEDRSRRQVHTRIGSVSEIE